MTHLSAAELVDYAEGTLDGGRVPHLDRCDRCRREGNALRATIGEAAIARTNVPEPSPLFWDHFSARVHERLADVPPDASWAMLGVRTFVPLGAFAVLLALLITPLMNTRTVPPHARAADARPPVAVDIDQPFDPALDATTGEVFDVLTAAGADVEWDTVHDAGMAVTAGALDRAVQQMSDAELHELARLLQSQLKRSSD